MARADFTPEYFLALVKNKGYPAVWEQAMACPNRIGDKTKHNINCTVCEGRQYVYHTPATITVALTSLTLKEMWREIGRFDLGTAMVTTEPAHRLGYWDKLTLTENRLRYTEPMQRLPRGADKLRYPPLTITRAVGADGTTTYTQGIDFTLLENKITWLPNKGPGIGGFYALSYFYRPVYIVLDLIHAIRDTPLARAQGHMVEMPVQAIARLDYLLADRTAEDEV
jgi:hypothetical protein